MSFERGLFYKIATLGLGKSLYEARAARREEEIAHVATDTLLNLPPNFSEINNTPRFEKTLHTNTSKGYQIVLEGTEIVIYKITNEKHTHDGVVTQDKNSRESLINFSSESEFEQFVTHSTGR